MLCDIENFQAAPRLIVVMGELFSVEAKTVRLKQFNCWAVGKVMAYFFYGLLYKSVS